jgi:GNAT superfamily N-acetyltransferase
MAEPASAGQEPDTSESPTRPPAAGVRHVVEAEVGQLAQMLARSFDDDPVMAFWLPSPRRRGARMARFFRALLGGLVLPAGEAYTTGDLSSAALWAPPEPSGGLAAFTNPSGGAHISWTDAYRLIRVMTPLGRRAFTESKAFAAVASHHPKEPHWYLMVLGTDPSRQGQGLGSAVLQPVLTRCDTEGLPAYLESSKEENLAFYARHRFAVTAEVTIPNGGPTLWCMRRSPRPA